MLSWYSRGANGDAIRAARRVSKVLSSGRSFHPSSIAGSQQLRDRDWACTIAQSFWVRVPLSYFHIHPHTFLLVRVSLTVGGTKQKAVEMSSSPIIT